MDTDQPPDPDWTHILVETSSLDDVKGALRGSSRLKFTCIDVSSKFLILGSNTGSVYVFGRSSQKHPHVIFPEVDPAQVNCIAISPTDKAVAFSTVIGHVNIVELTTDRRQKPERLRVITDHLQSTVTCITWDPTGSKLYTADAVGRTFVTSIPSSKVQNLVSLPPEVILKLESPICQVDILEDKLLVSTLKKCYICYTLRHKFTPVGSKPRDGEYGACFYRQASTGFFRIFCARPGSRIWEVDLEGNVLNTHIFKQLLAVPSLPMVSSVDYSWHTPSNTDMAPKGLAFPHLKTSSENFLFTWNKNNLYVLDPVKIKVIFWTDLGSEIQNIVSSDGYLFIFFLNGNIKKTKIYLIPQCISFLIAKKSWVLAADICSYFQLWIVKMRWKKYVSVLDLEKLKSQCTSSGKDLAANIIENIISSYSVSQDSGSELEDSFSDRSRSSSNASIQKLDCGIYQINNPSSLLSPEVMSIPEDFQKGSSPVVNSLLKNLKSEILDLMDNTTKEVVSDKNDSVVNKSSDDNVNAKNNTIYSREDSETDLHNEFVRKSDETDLTYFEGNFVETANFSINFVNKLSEHKKELLSCDHNSIATKDLSVNQNAEEKSIDHVIIIRNTIEKERESTMFNFSEGNKSNIEDKYKPDKQDILTNDDIEPLIVVSGSAGKKKKLRRKRSVNDVVLEEDSTRSDMRRTKSMGSISKTSEKKLPHKQSFNDPLMEENASQPIDIEDKTPVSKSLGSQESSPAGSLINSWESTGSETFAGLRKKSLTSKIDSVQSKITTTKNKLLQAIRQTKLSRSPGKEGKSTPDTSSLDSVDGVIISVDKVQKDLVELAPIIKGPIDLSELQKNTEETRRMLQDVNILLNPTELQKALSDWIKYLNQSLCQLHTFIYVERLRKFHSCSEKISEVTQTLCSNINEGIDNSVELGTRSSRLDNNGDPVLKHVDSLSLTSNQSENSSKSYSHVAKWIENEKLDFNTICHINDPFYMEPDFHQKVAELTQMCFDCGCHGDILNFTFPSHHKLVTTEICEKCNELVDVEKFQKSLYNCHQRDSGFIETSDSKKHSNDSYPLIKDESSENKENNKFQIKADIQIENNILSYAEKKNGEEHTEAECEGHVYDMSAKYDDLLDESEPHSCSNSDKSLTSLSSVGQDLQSFPCDQQDGHTLDLLNKEQIIPGYASSVDIHREQDISLNNIVEQCNELKHHSCFYCHQGHVVCFHGNHINKDFSSILTFIQSYFFLFDISKLKAQAYHCEEPSYHIWCGLVSCMRECCREDTLFNKMEQELSTTTDLLRLGEFPQSKILGYLSRLFEINPKKAIDFCISSTAVYPIDVLNFCRLCSLPVNSHFNKYMKAKVTDTDGHKLYENSLVVKTWMEILLKSTDYRDKVFDESGNPMPWSHFENWIDQDIIDHVISIATEELTPYYVEICKQVGYWRGYLILLKRQERCRDMLIIILHLQDVKLLDFNKVNGTLPSTTEEWKWFLEEFSQRNKQHKVTVLYFRENYLNNVQSQGEKSQSHDRTERVVTSLDDVKHVSISWDDVGHLMLQNLGPVSTVQLIQDCDMTEKMFSLSFFQSCVLSSFIHRQQRNVTHSLLEKLDSYLWTKKPNTLMPELQYIVTSEKEGALEDEKDDKHDTMIYLTSDQSLVSKQYREDMESHWGTSIKINRSCKNCNILLTETVSHVEPGVLIFPCGHGFHKFCCPLRECILCVDFD